MLSNGLYAGEAGIGNLAFLDHVHGIFAYTNTARQFRLADVALFTFLTYTLSVSITMDVGVCLEALEHALEVLDGTPFIVIKALSVPAGS
ncbi:MAG: hypothetical protein AB7N91_00330 [Candidatus Tectimicrobiota bacterium]